MGSVYLLFLFDWQLVDVIVHHEAASNGGDDGFRADKTVFFVECDGTFIVFVDGVRNFFRSCFKSTNYTFCMI